MRLKAGVRIAGLQPETLLAVMIARGVWADHGIAHLLTITSVTEGRHRAGSKHYTGCAFDLRTKGLSVSAATLTAALLDALPTDFDVILEDPGGPNEHIHVEYDPKAGLNL